MIQSNHPSCENRSFDFLRSALSKDGEYIKTSDVITWLEVQNNNVQVSINKTTFDHLNEWSFKDGRLTHDSGRFFSIDGIRVTACIDRQTQWDQPIINQPEVGYLGFIVKYIKGILHFLVQAKIEPGNINYVQLSPTLQATRSNYEQAHKGKKPLYLEYFQHACSDKILLDQLQSEQGARFLKKRNRNIIIQVDEDIPIYDNFTWLTLAQLKDLMQYDNLVNMDSRTVISGIPFGSFNSDVIDFFNFLGKHNSIQKDLLNSALISNGEVHSIKDIITFLTDLKSSNDLSIMHMSLHKIKNWVLTDTTIQHIDYKYFKVIAANIEIGNREVVSWGQPMIEPVQEGLCAFVAKKINGILHFAVQAKLECGNHDTIEFAPTVQTLTDDYRKTKKNTLPFLDYVLNIDANKVYFDTLQSEEGGRFFKEQNRNMIIIAGDEVPDTLPDRYIWMTLNQLYTFLRFNNYHNIQARSLIAAITFA